MARALAIVLGLGLAACSHAAPAPSSAHYQFPTEPKSILVITDHVANAAFAPLHGAQVANALRHFTPDTRWTFIDQITSENVAHADAVVYLGDNAAAPIPPRALEALRRAKRLVLTRFHVAQLHDAQIAFLHVHEGQDTAAPAALRARYRGSVISVQQSDYLDLTLDAPAEAIAQFTVGNRSVPYIVRDGRATFINGTIDYDRLEANPESFGMAAVISDVLNDALGASPLPDTHDAMLRLEDVSVQTQASRLQSIVEYLAAQGVPYGIGVIPDQLIKGHTLSTLDQDPELVAVLKYAQGHGATIILHGLHHSFNSPEDFEFWDPVHHHALPIDSKPWMDGKITEGLRIERALGLQPRMWETPHYSASALDYGEISKSFRVAWEDRQPNGWLPWALQRDAFGTILLPENLGYVANDGSTTVEDQLAIAKKLLICRGCIAAGFLHPATIPLEDFQKYVTGLRALGFQFVDPGGFLR